MAALASLAPQAIVSTGRNRREEFLFGHHVVCVLDLLGQKERLAKWAAIEGPDAVSQLPAIRQTVGAVLVFREMFQDLFEAFEKPTSITPLVERLSAEKQSIFAKHKACSLGTQQFSDTFVFYAPTAIGNEEVSATGLYRILAACCMTLGFAFAAKVPVRGGVSVGMGVELAENNFYGPALAEAHQIESKVAQWPRVVMAHSAINFIKCLIGRKCTDDFALITREMARVCGSLICAGRDELLMVDWLGKGFRRIVNAATLGQRMPVDRAYDFVRTERKRFQADGNRKLATRYESLRDYIESRLGLWGMEPIEYEG